ncbi:MAG: ABC transporter permease subunit [Dysgonamonadaceae bacterium]|jgi:phosphate transport system permease protein|nr:ABC transporter permease subunit [Dysgonamonadaceae bacterium]
MRDKAFKVVLLCACGVVLCIILAMLYTLFAWSFPVLKGGTLSATLLLYESYVIGTFASAGLAVLLSVLFSLSIASLTVEYYHGRCISRWIKHLLIICRNIPSIIWGIGAFYILPDKGFFTIVFVLTIMITPYASSWVAAAMDNVSISIRESAYSLGATSTAVLGKIIIPAAGKGILAAYALAFVKALGETMIIAVFAGNTITGGLLHSFSTHTIHPVWGVLALGLFLVTTGINGIASSILYKYIR